MSLKSNATTAASYRTYSGTAAELYESFFVPAIARPVSNELLTTANLTAGERVLDLACGTGVITRAAAEQVGSTGTVIGVDIAPEMLDIARTIPAAGAPIEWLEADAASLPLPDATYDVALCQMGLMFMPDKASALRQLRRVLTPDGRVLITTPGPMQPVFEAIQQAIGEHIDPELGEFLGLVFSMHDPSALQELFADAGFADVSAREYTAALDLPEPAEFLWNYLHLTPIGQHLDDAPTDAKLAMEHDVVQALTPRLIDGRTPLNQPMVLATGTRT